MGKTSSAHTLSSGISISSLVEFLVFQGILKWVIKFQKFYSKSQYEKRSFMSELVDQKLSTIHEKEGEEGEEGEEDDDGKLSREDVEMVMRDMRLTCSSQDDDDDDDRNIYERLGLDELLGLFEEKEPSVDEVRGAFDVFDENSDGFIDAAELHKVLSTVGIRRGLTMEDCNRMITSYDDNRDGRIDFNEFVKLMEKSFC